MRAAIVVNCSKIVLRHATLTQERRDDRQEDRPSRAPETGCDAPFLREMIGFVAQWLTELEAEGLYGTGHGEHSPGRQNQRNGFREKEHNRK